MLSNDTSRCMGRENQGPDAMVCPMRDTCLRYRAAVHGGEGEWVPYAMWMCGREFDQRIDIGRKAIDN